MKRASLDAIKVEDLIPSGLPQGMELGEHGHLFERIHRKRILCTAERTGKMGLGTQNTALKSLLRTGGNNSRYEEYLNETDVYSEELLLPM